MLEIKNIKIKTIAIHISIWVGYSLLIFYGPVTFLPLKAALFFGIRALLINAFIFYFNTLWLLPRYLFAAKTFKYLMMVLLISACAATINLATEQYILPQQNTEVHANKPIDETRRNMTMTQSIHDKNDRPDFDAHDHLKNDGVKEPHPMGPPPMLIFKPGRVPPAIFHGILSSLGMIFISTLFAYIIRDRELQQKRLDLTNKNLEFEMKFLKSQINPHFLFNALNNVYALSVIKAENTPEMILKLSEMLRFTLYDSENKRVKLERELNYISNYIDFQRLKMDTEPNMTISIDQCNTELMLEPMLLIPFVENSFKHSHIENTKRGWIKLKIHTLGPMLFFQISNSIMPNLANKDLPGGIGLENVRKRLEMLYPGRFELKIESSSQEHRVQMMIDTGKNE